MNPFDRPGPVASGAYPLLILAGSRTLFYDAGGMIVFPAVLHPPTGRQANLEENERRLADGREPLTEDLVWSPEDPAVRAFLARVFAGARRAGGLRVHAYLGEDLPLEALSFTGEEWSRAFPILRVSQSPAGEGNYRGRRRYDLEATDTSAPAETGRDAAERILIYDNPAGEPLPRAREEARTILGLCEGFETRFIARALSEAEWRREFLASRAVIYCGHGKNISGLLAIPTPGEAGWMPFLPPGAGGGRFLVFNACLSGADGAMRTPGNFCILPVCRIADRPAPFITDMLQGWLETGDPGNAFMRAARSDAARSDQRRLVFRLQGFAEEP